MLIKQTTLLTVTIAPDAGYEAADRDLELVAQGQQVIRSHITEGYLHRLRLRVAESPELASKITAYAYTETGELQDIGLTLKDELKWPVGELTEARNYNAVQVGQLETLEKERDEARAKLEAMTKAIDKFRGCQCCDPVIDSIIGAALSAIAAPAQEKV